MKTILGSVEFDEKGCLKIEGFNDFYDNYSLDKSSICSKDARIAELKKLAAFYLEEKQK